MRVALLIAFPAVGALVLTHTRTALVAAAVGLLAAGVSLFVQKRRVRRVFATVIAVIAFLVLPFSPLITSWLARGESSSQLTDLTGRTTAWAGVLSEPKPELNKIFGSGLSNAAVNGALDPGLDGLPIDSSWLSTYQDQGIAGDVLDGAMFFALLFIALTRPKGPACALALFLIAYCFLASFTESGMGEPSSYLLDLTVAASLLAVPLAGPSPGVSRARRYQLLSAIA